MSSVQQLGEWEDVTPWSPVSPLTESNSVRLNSPEAPVINTVSDHLYGASASTGLCEQVANVLKATAANKQKDPAGPPSKADFLASFAKPTMASKGKHKIEDKENVAPSSNGGAGNQNRARSQAKKERGLSPGPQTIRSQAAPTPGRKRGKGFAETSQRPAASRRPTPGRSRPQKPSHGQQKTQEKQESRAGKQAKQAALSPSCLKAASRDMDSLPQTCDRDFDFEDFSALHTSHDTSMAAELQLEALLLTSPEADEERLLQPEDDIVEGPQNEGSSVQEEEAVSVLLGPAPVALTLPQQLSHLRTPSPLIFPLLHNTAPSCKPTSH